MMIITKEMKDFFLNIVSELFSKEEYFKEFRTSRTHSSIIYDQVELDIGQNYSIEAISGATRLCLIIDKDYGYDYVVKIPYIDRSIDYCAREVEIYEEAIKAGIEEVFAECALLEVITINEINFPIYLMERVDSDYNELDSLCFSYYKKNIYEGDISDDDKIISEEYCRDLYDSQLFEEYDLALAETYEKKTDILEHIRQFLVEKNINDLHNGNIRVMGQRVVLIDYAGFMG